MANYNVSITDGAGSARMSEGEYSVSVNAAGYDATSLSPTTYTVTRSAGSGTFTVSAVGTLTLSFNETGASGGIPITSGTVVMTDSTGAVEYGSPVTISATGEGVFECVPFGTLGEPITLYFKQLSSDGNHYVESGVISVSMDSIIKTSYVQNLPFAEQNFTLTDANYAGLPVNGTLDFVS